MENQGNRRDITSDFKSLKNSNHQFGGFFTLKLKPNIYRNVLQDISVVYLNTRI